MSTSKDALARELIVSLDHVRESLGLPKSEETRKSARSRAIEHIRSKGLKMETTADDQIRVYGPGFSQTVRDLADFKFTK